VLPVSSVQNVESAVLLPPALPSLCSRKSLLRRGSAVYPYYFIVFGAVLMVLAYSALYIN
jgi:hypothetical protein